MAFDENGLQLTDGFLDHTTWHCWVLEDYMNGSGSRPWLLRRSRPGRRSGRRKYRSRRETRAEPKELKGSATFTTGPENFAGSVAASSM